MYKSKIKELIKKYEKANWTRLAKLQINFHRASKWGLSYEGLDDWDLIERVLCNPNWRDMQAFSAKLYFEDGRIIELLDDVDLDYELMLLTYCQASEEISLMFLPKSFHTLIKL